MNVIVYFVQASDYSTVHTTHDLRQQYFTVLLLVLTEIQSINQPTKQQANQPTNELINQ